MNYRIGFCFFLLGWTAALYAQESLPTPNLTSTPSLVIKTTLLDLDPNLVAMYPKQVYTYLSPLKDGFSQPKPNFQVYPVIDITGFHELRFSGRDFSPKSPSDSRFETIRRDPYYEKLPRDVLIGPPQLDMRYQYTISGQLDKDLKLTYDVEQERDLPGKFDVKVNYKRTKIQFGFVDTFLSDGELISIHKSINGWLVHSDTDTWETTFATGQLRSNPSRFADYGNGTRTLSLGARSILADSVKIWVNNIPMSEGRDYTVNLYQGEVTFKDIRGPTDYVVVVYEFTNPVEDFIPGINRKQFIGGQFLWQTPYTARTLLSQKIIADEVIKPSGATPNSIYLLAYSPVILASEQVRLNGKQVRYNRDYIIKPYTGTFVWISGTPLQPSDNLTISYRYFESALNQDTLIGKNGPGPYFLSRSPVVEGSLVMTLEGLPVTENQDYTVDYEKGTVQFRYSIDSPHIMRAAYRAIQTQTEVPTRSASPLSLGITYATEYTPPDPQSGNQAVPSESQTTSGNIIYTSLQPLDPSRDIRLSINGVNVATSNYSLDPFQGKFTLANPPSGSYTAVISYTYLKSYRTNYAFRFKSPIVRTYVLDELRDIPARYNSVSSIRVQSATGGEYSLAPGADFTVDYGVDGQTMTLTFKTSQDSPGALLSTVPSIQDTLTLFYEYTPPGGQQSQGTLSQQMLGVTAANRWDDHWQSRAELALSEHNYSKAQLPFEQGFAGNGLANHSYVLASANFVENSESVFLNGRRMNRDADYTFNYALGRIRFIRFTPGLQDTISVNAKVLDSSVTQAGERKNALATKLSTQYQTEDLLFKGDFKYIDRQYIPIGELQEARGSTVFGGSVSWNATTDTTIESDYHHRDVFASQFRTDTGAPIYIHRDEIYNRFSLNNVGGMFDSTQSLRWITEVSDPDPILSPSNPHGIDTLTWAYTGSVGTGNTLFRNDLSAGYSEQTSDYLDLLNKRLLKTEKMRFDNTTFLSSLYILGDTRFSPYYEYANSQAEQSTPTGDSVITTTSFRKTTEWGFLGSVLPFTFLPISTEWHDATITSRLETQPTLSVQSLHNSKTNFQFIPTTWMSSGINLYHTEIESPLIGQRGAIEDQRIYSLNQLQLNGLFKSVGVAAPPWYLSPFFTTSLAASRSENDRKDNNSRLLSNSNGNSFSIQNIVPLPGVILRSYTTSDTHSRSQNQLDSTVSSRNISSSDGSSHGINFNLFPPLPVLNAWTYSVGFEDRQNKTLSQDEAIYSTTNISSQSSLYFKRSQDLKFNPGRLSLPLILAPPLDLGSFSALFNESFSDQTTRTSVQSYFGEDRTSLLSSALSQDSSRVQIFSASTQYSPLSILNSTETYKDTTEFYSRNLVTLYAGTTHKKTLDYGLTAELPVFSFLTLSGSGAWTTLTQYQAATLNAELTTLESQFLLRNSVSPSLLTNFIRKNNSSYQAGTSWSFWSSTAYTLQAGYTLVEQALWSPSGDATAGIATGDSTYRITQKWGAAGITWLPISGFSAGYLYTFKFSNDSLSGSSTGYTGTTTLAYTPLQTPGFKVSFTYRRDDTWGKDFNTLAIQGNEQASGATLVTQIVERLDAVELATLSVDINLSMRHISPVMDKLVITGEGYFKKVTDRLDPDHGIKRSYDLSGMLLKGTLFF